MLVQKFVGRKIYGSENSLVWHFVSWTIRRLISLMVEIFVGLKICQWKNLSVENLLVDKFINKKIHRSKNLSSKNSSVEKFISQKICQSKNSSVEKFIEKFVSWWIPLSLNSLVTKFVGWKFIKRKLCRSKILLAKNLSKNSTKRTKQKNRNKKNQKNYLKEKNTTTQSRFLEAPLVRQADGKLKNTEVLISWIIKKRTHFGADFIYEVPHVFLHLYFELSVILKMFWRLLFIFLHKPNIFKSRYLWIAPHK